jgi:hypothetical protein
MKKQFKRKQQSEIRVIASGILSSTELTRSQANYLIKTICKMSVKEFADNAMIGFKYLNDSLIAIRPLSTDLQKMIIEYAKYKLKRENINVTSTAVAAVAS